MLPYTQEIATLKVMVAGFAGALERTEKAAREVESSGQVFIALFETLNWAVAIDDRVAAHWEPGPRPTGGDGQVIRPWWAWRDRVENGKYMSATRFVRNRVHHQWADALRRDDGGRSYPRTYPVVYHEWVWRPVDELPTGRDTNGLVDYVDVLADQSARATLRILVDVFDWVRQRMEPERCTVSRPHRLA